MSVNDGAKEVDNGEDFDGVQFAYFQPLPEMHWVRSNAMRPVSDRFGSTVVFY